MSNRGVIREENIYGHLKRLDWMKSAIKRDGSVLEVGCGTGSFITTPLLLDGFDAYGIDIGPASIRRAKRLAEINGLSAERYRCMGVEDLTERYDTVVCSEVMEHIGGQELPGFVCSLCGCVKPGGRLIITVPNGRGCYELGQTLRKRTAPLRERMRREPAHPANAHLKRVAERESEKYKCPSLTDSPHVQFFSMKDICNLIMPRGFRLEAFTGSTLIAGDFMNKPHKILYRVNNALGSLFPRIASGYYFCFVKTA